MSENLWQKQLPGYRAYLPVDLPPEASYVYRGNNTMSSALIAPNLQWLHGSDEMLVSHDVVVLGDQDTSKYILAGALTAKRSLTYFTVIRRGRLRGVEVFMPHIADGEEPEKLVVLEGNNPEDLLIKYAELAAEAHNHLRRSTSPSSSDIDGTIRRGLQYAR